MGFIGVIQQMDNTQNKLQSGMVVTLSLVKS